MSFQAGDVVYLKSGGPAMTVRWVNHDECACEWFINNQELKGDKFLVTSLTKESPRKAGTAAPVKTAHHF
ncbi:YodC family protein [Acinetobacter sp. CIP 64.2]|uniref:YodC family protein n=1 Tax=Acinetobacter sp. CIP 64.2 TaxID=1217694 RepID=UPI0002886EF4|nr:DUF2158 domain-containing protein [Acinetobacter sp. CIP 64.2]